MGQKCSINCIDNITCPRALGLGFPAGWPQGVGARGEGSQAERSGLENEDGDQLEEVHPQDVTLEGGSTGGELYVRRCD